MADVSEWVNLGGAAALTERGFHWSTTNGFANGTGTKFTATGTGTGANGELYKIWQSGTNNTDGI